MTTAIKTIRETAADILETYAKGDSSSKNNCGHDAGPMVLTAACFAAGVVPKASAQEAVLRWLNDLPENIRDAGAFGGLGGFRAGMRAASQVDDRLKSLNNVVTAQTGRLIAQFRWRWENVAWRDYDLFFGPAGLLLAGVADVSESAVCAPAAYHLELLSEDLRLEGLRAGPDISPLSAFNIGRINTGMGHGVTGVVAALRHAMVTFNDGESYRPALERACTWLAKQSYVDERGLITWPPVGLDGGNQWWTGIDRRQAWCYGTPGVAWTLWSAGQSLDDSYFHDLGKAAMLSFCELFDEDLYIDKAENVRKGLDPLGEALGICHGAAGTLAVADAFARHAGLREAEDLRQYLTEYLLIRIQEVRELGLTDMTMLTGAGGIMSVLLTAHGGIRSWLSHIALQ